MKAELQVNGRKVEVEGPPMTRLLDLLREQAALKGTKEGCGEGECGACTVLMDGRPVLSCLIPLVQCPGREIVTVEGVVEAQDESTLDRLVAEGGIQCGACTPGIVVTASALLRENAHPERSQVIEALAGNLCRCTGYEGILRSLVGPESTE